MSEIDEVTAEHAGVPDDVATLLASFGTSARLGYADVVTDAVQQLTGRPATSLADLIESS